MHQSFVSTAPPPTGKGGIMTFHLSKPWYKPHLVGQADDNNPDYPALSSRVKFPNVIISALRGQSKSKYPAPHPTYSMATPVGWGPWIQMTDALSLNQWTAYKYSYLAYFLFASS